MLQTKAIVLRAERYRSSTFVCSMLAEKCGLINVLLNIKKAKNNPQRVVEVGQVFNLYLKTASESSFYRCQSSELSESPDLKSYNAKKWLWQNLFSEAISKSSHDVSKSELFYNFLYFTFYENSSDLDFYNRIIQFLFHFLYDIGFQFDYFSCKSCKVKTLNLENNKILLLQRNFKFDFKDQKIICNVCSHENNDLGPWFIKFCYFSLNFDYPKKMSLSENQIYTLLNFFNSALKDMFNIELNSWSALKEQF